jgi:hypothetical protein
MLAIESEPDIWDFEDILVSAIEPDILVSEDKFDVTGLEGIWAPVVEADIQAPEAAFYTEPEDRPTPHSESAEGPPHPLPVRSTISSQ